jgi:hypothetical protein
VCLDVGARTGGGRAFQKLDIQKIVRCVTESWDLC